MENLESRVWGVPVRLGLAEELRSQGQLPFKVEEIAPRPAEGEQLSKEWQHGPQYAQGGFSCVSVSSPSHFQCSLAVKE